MFLRRKSGTLLTDLARLMRRHAGTAQQLHDDGGETGARRSRRSLSQKLTHQPQRHHF